MSNVYRDPEDPDKLRRIVEAAVETATNKAIAKAVQSHEANQDSVVNVI